MLLQLLLRLLLLMMGTLRQKGSMRKDGTSRHETRRDMQTCDAVHGRRDLVELL